MFVEELVFLFVNVCRRTSLNTLQTCILITLHSYRTYRYILNPPSRRAATVAFLPANVRAAAVAFLPANVGAAFRRPTFRDCSRGLSGRGRAFRPALPHHLSDGEPDPGRDHLASGRQPRQPPGVGSDHAPKRRWSARIGIRGIVG